MAGANFGYTVKERNLLLQSYHVQKDFPSFFEYLQKHSKAKRLSQKEEASDKMLALLLSRTDRTLSEIIETSKTEWSLLVSNSEPECKEDPQKLSVCELCGQKGLRYLHTIINQYNNNQLIVGSECVHEYELYGIETNGIIRENFFAQIRERRNMNRATAEMNTQTQNGVLRIHSSIRAWNNIQFLPSPELTSEIISLKDSSRQMLKKISKSDLPHSKNMISECKCTAEQFQKLLDKARNEISQETNDWRISNKVYKWAENNEKNRKHKEIMPLLLKECRITPDNVALIMEDEHKNECIKRLEQVLPEQIRIKYLPEQSDKIKLYIKIKQSEYPFWIFYRSLVSKAVIHGFLVEKTLTPFLGAELLSMGVSLDMQDGDSVATFLRKQIQEAGGSFQDENDRGDRYLIRINKYGHILDVDTLSKDLAKAILTEDTAELLIKLKTSFFGGKPTEYDVVRQNWNDTYINRHY